MCLGIPGQIVAISDRRTNSESSTCRAFGARSTSCASIDENHPIESCVGDWVLVHVGFAMSRIDETEAAATLKILEQLGEVEPELAAMRVSGEADGLQLVSNRKEPLRCQTIISKSCIPSCTAKGRIRWR